MYRMGRLRGSCSAGRHPQRGWGASEAKKKAQERGGIPERHAGAVEEQRGSVHLAALLEGHKETEENCRYKVHIGGWVSISVGPMLKKRSDGGSQRGGERWCQYGEGRQAGGSRQGPA